MLLITHLHIILALTTEKKKKKNFNLKKQYVYHLNYHQT